MPSERSSLLSLQRRQQQELEKKQYQLQIERQRQQFNNQRHHHQRSQQVHRGPSYNNNSSHHQSIDLLSDDDNDNNESSNNLLNEINNYNSRTHDSYPDTNTTNDLIQLNENELFSPSSTVEPLNENTKRNVKELHLRAQHRKKSSKSSNSNNAYGDDDFESINGAIQHINLQDEEHHHRQSVEILNSFDEDEEGNGGDDVHQSQNSNKHTFQGNYSDNNELLGLRMIDEVNTTNNNNHHHHHHDQTPNLMDGTFYVHESNLFGNHHDHNQQATTATTTTRQRVHQNLNQRNGGAKKAISALFGMSFKNRKENEINSTNRGSIYVDSKSNHHQRPNIQTSNASDLLSNTTTTNNQAQYGNKVAMKGLSKPSSSSLLDQVVERPSSLSTTSTTNIMSNVTQNQSIIHQFDPNHMNTNSEEVAQQSQQQQQQQQQQQNTMMKTVRSPLQISSSSLDPELFMSSQQQHYLPDLSDTISNQYNINNASSYLGEHYHNNNSSSKSKMTFRHTTLSSGITNNTNNNSNNIDTARSWFGGNLNTNTGSTIPSSSLSVATTSTTSSLYNEESKKRKNQHIHVIGSSSSTYNQTLPGYFEQQQQQQQQQSGKGGNHDSPSYASTQTKRHDSSHWNWLNIALFLSYGFTTSANLVPITLIPTIAMDVLRQTNDMNEGDDNYDDQSSSMEGLASKFASVVATYAVLGTALGKFLNGSLGDIFGARRVACYFSLLHSFALLMLSFCVNEWSVISCCVAVEYHQSVQWPCIAVILATHYGNGILGDEGGGDYARSPAHRENGDVRVGDGNEGGSSSPDGKYEKGIYIASLGSRGGALFASMSTTMFLRYGGMGWRGVARLASLGSFLGFAIMYLFVTDSPKKLHDPQNPIKGDIPEVRQLSTFTFYRLRNSLISMKDITEGIQATIKLVSIVFSRNILPSLRSVLSNVTFWVVAIAHSGGLMVCSSIRILGTYFRDTSYGTISQNQAGFVSLFLSVGILVGLFFGGNTFGDLSNNPKARKSMVSKLYILTVTMCYTLSFLAIPMVRSSINSPNMIAFLQAIATFVMGAGVAVQVYCIPAIVGCTFGANKGLYASYTDGVAYTISSLVWRIMGNAVEEGNPEGAGWAYGWAAVALLVILAGFLMIEFVEHYFCRGGWIGRLRDAEAKAKYDRDNEVERSLGEESSVSKIAQSGKRMWEKSHSLFKPITLGRRKGPDMNSILSIDDDDDDESTILFESSDYVEDLTPPDELASQIQNLLKVECNRTCVDCGSPFPRWASIIVPNHQSSLDGNYETKALGAFCCSQCAGSHRKLGTHIVFVRSVDHDNFRVDEVNALQAGGNVVVNSLYEAKLPYDDPLKIDPSSTSIKRESFIAAKYERKLWYYYINHDSQMYGPSEIELVHGLTSPQKDSKYIKKESPSSVVENTANSVFEQVAPVDQDTIEHYESFVRNGSDSQSEYSHKKKLGDDGSMSSEESDAWQISGNERGLDVYIDL